VPPAALHQLLQVLTGAATSVTPVETPLPNTIELTSVGAMATVLTWAALLAINLWCLRRILKKQPTS